VIEVFNNGGSQRLDIPEPPSSCPPPSAVTPEMTKVERFQAYRERMALRRRKAEMYSLWCDTLYRLSLANHVSEKFHRFQNLLLSSPNLSNCEKKCTIYVILFVYWRCSLVFWESQLIGWSSLSILLILLLFHFLFLAPFMSVKYQIIFLFLVFSLPITCVYFILHSS
jgi:hypothetical protein